LVWAIATQSQVPGFVVRTIAELPPQIREEDLTERAITADQTNISVVVGERVVVKWMRPENAARAPELLAHLTANGFSRTPTPYGAVYRDGTLAALVTAHLPEATDGWQWCVDAVLSQLDGGPPANFAAELGVLVAELHAALATPSKVIASPVRYEVPPNGGLAVLAEALGHARAAADVDGRWFAERMPLIAADILAGVEPAGDRGPVPVIRTHGDLHVGQVLRWRHGYAVIDFDGNPTAPSTWEPAARDIAQLRTSLLHVAQIADRRSAGQHRNALLNWAGHSAQELLDAYQTGLTKRGLGDLLDDRLIRPYEVEQECRELVYAARFLPRWRYAPMGVLRSWYP
jgi:maltokinase